MSFCRTSSKEDLARENNFDWVVPYFWQKQLDARLQSLQRVANCFIWTRLCTSIATTHVSGNRKCLSLEQLQQMCNDTSLFMHAFSLNQWWCQQCVSVLYLHYDGSCYCCATFGGVATTVSCKLVSASRLSHRNAYWVDSRTNCNCLCTYSLELGIMHACIVAIK